MGYIYIITTDFDDNSYIGQTARDIEVRLLEHCTEKIGTSRLHHAIQEHGYNHFSIKQLEEVPLSLLDEREQYWKSKLNTYYNELYNKENFDETTFGLLIEERNIIAPSKEKLVSIISKATSWDKRNIARIIDTGRGFLGYHFRNVILNSNTKVSDYDVLKDWAKTLAIMYPGKHIYCLELDKHFSSIAEAAKTLSKKSTVHTNINTLVTEITKNLKQKIESVDGLTFLYIPGSIEAPDEKKIFCPQIDKEFKNQAEAARYFIDNGLWQKMKLKTAKCRISDIINGYFSNYLGYTFEEREDSLES